MKYCKDSKAFIEYPNDMDDIYENIKECNSNKKRKLLIVFDDIIADILYNKNLNPVVTESFIKSSKLTFVLFLSQNLILLYQKILDKILHTV